MSISQPGSPSSTFYTVHGGIDTYWRSELPVRHTGSKWVRIPNVDRETSVLDPNKGSAFPWWPRIEGQDFFPDANIFWDSWSQVYDQVHYPEQVGKVAVFNKPSNIMAKHAISMEAQGIRTVAELDDTLLASPMLNVFLRSRGFRDRQRYIHLMSFAAFNAIVFSTEALRDAYHKAFRKEIFKPKRTKRDDPDDIRPLRDEMPELHVASNHSDLNDWPAIPVYDGPLRVGWMGSHQHYRDVKHAYGALRMAKDVGCRIFMVGADFSDETGVTNPKSLEVCRQWGALQSEKIPWVEPEIYHRTALPFDIGVIPLENNAHTMGKSDVKAIEYAMSNVAIVAQNHPVYSKFWKHNETCLLANSNEEFGQMVAALIKDSKLRHRLAGAAAQYVAEERTMQAQGRREWEEALWP